MGRANGSGPKRGSPIARARWGPRAGPMTGSAKPITFLKCRSRSDGSRSAQPILRATVAYRKAGGEMMRYYGHIPASQKSYVCIHVFNNERPILLVNRSDGSWCFLCGGGHEQAASN